MKFCSFANHRAHTACLLSPTHIHIHIPCALVGSKNCAAILIMLLDLIHTSPLLFNLQATTTNAPEPTAATSKPKSPCSDESTEDNGSQVKPEDNNLTSLDGVEINLTNNKPKSSQGQCNTFKPQEDATAGKGVY